jgi:phenylacetate-CoA ligase
MTDVARFEALRARLGELRGRSLGLARQLGDVDLGALRGPADLALIPVMRKSAIASQQAAEPPFGAFAAAPTSAFPRLFASPGGIYEPESAGRDPWGAAKALAAAGVTAGEIVVNCFSYHLTPGGRILESGALALGCPVIPAGPGNTEPLIAAIGHLRPSVYCGPPDFLKIVIDKARAAGADVSSLNKALVSGAALPPSLRAELEGAGVRTRQTYATADLGIIAYETDDPGGALLPGMLVNDELIVEIVTAGNDEPAAAGNVGEGVVTRLQGEYPLLRFATGDLSAWASPGRLKGWMGRADQSAKIKGPVRSSGPDCRDRQAPPRAWRSAPRRAPRRRAGRDDAPRRDSNAERSAHERGRRDAPGADQTTRGSCTGRARLDAERRQDHRRREARAVTGVATIACTRK